MAYEENLRSLSRDADASIGIFTGVPGRPGSAVPNGGKQYCLLKITGANQVGLAVAALDDVCGVLQNKPQLPGAAATVGYEGITKVIAGAAFNAGDRLGPDAQGRAIVQADGPLRAEAPAAGADEVVSASFVRG